MELFEGIIHEFRAFIDGLPSRRTWEEELQSVWPGGGHRSVVMREDLGCELGSPEMESVSCILWTGKQNLVKNGCITLVGPDFTEAAGHGLPFGKIVLAGVDGFDEENTYDRHRDLDLLRYDLDLKGFMIRAVSQHQKEWCRISADALRSGFSAQTLASSLMALFRAKDYVQSMEVILITSSPGDVRALREIVAPAARIIAAMDKMAIELETDCETCDYQDVCGDAEQLKAMRKTLQGKNREAYHA
ncbi:MAG: hypothetical protein MUD15_12365 [Desulfobacterota bacterium]|nr:hypothetical protein [Thermodesulfobacteriota bacterium]